MFLYKQVCKSTSPSQEIVFLVLNALYWVSFFSIEFAMGEAEVCMLPYSILHNGATWNWVYISWGEQIFF